MNFPLLTGFDLENNPIKPKTVTCFVLDDKGVKAAKNKFPFILI